MSAFKNATGDLQSAMATLEFHQLSPHGLVPSDFKAKTQNLTKCDWIIFYLNLKIKLGTLVKALHVFISTLLKIEPFFYDFTEYKYPYCQLRLQTQV